MMPKAIDVEKNMKIQNESLTEDLLIFDAHCDTANALLDTSFNFIKGKQSHVDMEQIGKGGLKAQIFALWVNPVYSPYRSIKKALLLYHILEKKVFSPGYGIKVTSTTEMESALRNNKLACWLSLEGGHIIENSIEILEFFYSLGIRSMTLTHTKNTDWADSSGEPPPPNGIDLIRLEERLLLKWKSLV
jgi:membrane dipeptidase